MIADVIALQRITPNRIIYTVIMLHQLMRQLREDYVGLHKDALYADCQSCAMCACREGEVERITSGPRGYRSK